MSGFTEGVYVDHQSVEWDNDSVFNIVDDVNGDPQLIDIEGQVHKKQLRQARKPDDIFPNSIIIVREGVLDTVFGYFQSVMGGHHFPSRACLIVLEGRRDPAIVKQLKRDVGVNPDVASNCKELKTIVKSHLNEMDPGADEGIQNLCEFEKQVCQVSTGNYKLVPEDLRSEC